jgi:putative ABC transport system substrate-binding protein
MQRRKFITLLGSSAAWPLAARAQRFLGGAAAAWPVAARAQAQQRERMRRIGVLTPFAADDAEGNARLTAFAQALQQLGWTVGQNVRIDYRWGRPGNAETMRKLAAELVALAPDVILGSTSAAIASLCWRRAVPSRSCSRASPPRWLPVTSKAWRGQAATPPALPRSNTRSVENGWS